MEPTNQKETGQEVAKLSQVIQIDEGKIQAHLGEVVRSTVEETLNAMLDAEADRLCRAERYAPRLRLDRSSYETLDKQMLRRNGWRCQFCGSLRDLQVHHMQSRSLLGDAAEENLITLCAPCHRRTHFAIASLWHRVQSISITQN